MPVTWAAPAWSWCGCRTARPAKASPCRWGRLPSRTPGRFDPERVRAQVERRLKPYLDDLKTPVFHAVGGAWRKPGPAGDADVVLPAGDHPPVRAEPARGAGGGAGDLAPVGPLAGRHRGHIASAPGDPAPRCRRAGGAGRHAGRRPRGALGLWPCARACCSRRWRPPAAPRTR
ncbi:MAG: hypothetical protein WDM85_10725 [Caulobacteraceae bacterium]